MKIQQETLEWKLASRLSSVRGEPRGNKYVYNGFWNKLFKYKPRVVIPDSREELEDLGFQIIGEEYLFYRVKVPEGWRMETEGFGGDKLLSEVFDAEGLCRISQFHKTASWDYLAHIDILDVNEERKNRAEGRFPYKAELPLQS